MSIFASFRAFRSYKISFLFTRAEAQRVYVRYDPKLRQAGSTPIFFELQNTLNIAKRFNRKVRQERQER
jgi:hypothetical protein